MNVAEALEVDGKIESTTSNRIAFRDEFSILRWDDDDSLVMLEDIVGDWSPHYEEEEIRPETRGELWEYYDGDQCRLNFFTCISLGLNMMSQSGVLSEKGILGFMTGNKDIRKDVIHSKSGWTRLYPPVEDESVERIEVDVTWNSHDINCIYPVFNSYQFNPTILLSKPPMKMILEIPKDKV
jgi:hypothetical protein